MLWEENISYYENLEDIQGGKLEKFIWGSDI